MLPYPHLIDLKEGRRSSLVCRELTGMDRPDEYEIVMTEEKTLIRSGSESGFFYAAKTLRDLPAGRIGRIHDWADIPLRIAMIDLKRIDWNFDYLLSLFPLFADLRINACLLEYEDKFPYRFTDRIAVPGAFSADQIAEIVRTARENRVELIPLVQCFSHWEYILRHEEFAEIRESRENVSQGCPLNPRTFELFRSMLKEIVAAHPESRYIHIGGDEARLLGHCPACAAKVRESGIEGLYGDYLEAAIDEVNACGKTPLFWADFFWTHDRPRIRKNCIAVDWEYSPRAVRSSSAVIGIHEVSYGAAAENSRYAAFLKADAATRTVFGFPHLLWLREHGYRTFGAGNINSSDNMLAHAGAAAEEGTGAVMGTYWASADSLTSPITLYPWRICGLAMLGAAGWNVRAEQENRDSFYRRLAEKMGDSPSCGEVYRQMDNQGPMIAPLRYWEKPAAAEGRFALFGRKAALDYRLQTLFGDRTLFPDSAFEMLSIDRAANSTTDFRIGGEECRFTIGRLDFLPQGRFIWSGIPFELKDSLAVYGAFPGQTTPDRIVLDVGKQKHPGDLFVIQSLVGSVARGPEVGECVLHYRDSSVSLPLVLRNNLDNWWNIEDSGELRIAFTNVECRKENPHHRLGLHCWHFANPHPEKELLRLEFRITDRLVVALAAVTLLQKPQGMTPAAGSVELLNDLREELVRLRNDFRKELRACSAGASVEELEKIAFDSPKAYLERMTGLLCGTAPKI